MKNDNQTMLGEYPVGKLIMKMSVPSVIGIVAYNIYNIVDTIFIAKGVGTNAAGGLAVSFPFFLFLSALSTTLGSGAASVMSRAFGQKNFEKANTAAGNTFGLFWIAALLVTVFGLIFLNPILGTMGVTPALLPYARSFSRIILIGAVTSTGFSSLIRAEGSSKYAMYVWIIPVLVNIALDPILIFGFHLGVVGAACATVTAQCVSVFMSVYYFFLSGKSMLKIKPRNFIPNPRVLSDIFLVGLPSFIQLTGYGVTIILINQILKNIGGDLSISTYGIINKITAFAIIPITGIAQGIQPIIGYNFGSKMHVRVKETVKISSLIAAGYGGALSLMLLILSKQIMCVFTSDPDVINLGGTVLQIVNAGLMFSGVHTVQTAFFQSVGKKGISLLLSLCDYILCFIPVMTVLSSAYGINGVWFSFPIAAIITLVISTFLILRFIRREQYES